MLWTQDFHLRATIRWIMLSRKSQGFSIEEPVGEVRTPPSPISENRNDIDRGAAFGRELRRMRG